MKDQRTVDQYYTSGQVLNKEERARKRERKLVEKNILHPGFFSNPNIKEKECQNK